MDRGRPAAPGASARAIACSAAARSPDSYQERDGASPASTAIAAPSSATSALVTVRVPSAS
ncbi:hypothetical protein JKP75_15890 [Blastococcus sp. TML/M2B]|uniref:hypothetical protein n=1 Tax=Blastococcus sp. TML/M2B TaxID=2798727 RepID=UPI00190C84CC|nr:hypothetical protein [Blastococcus sp. TML/M2B]MBN1093904.1 hypothetical protein [Blastococcus sp. TML/M2B]